MADTPPIMFPPPRNFDYPGRGPVIVGVTWAPTSLTVMATLLRMYLRKKKLSANDWLMFVVIVNPLRLRNHTPCKLTNTCPKRYSRSPTRS